MAFAGQKGSTSSATASPNEVSADRTATSRTFDLPGGWRETRLYPAPVNYETAKARWKPIGEGLREAEGATLENGANDFEARLPKQIDSGAARIAVGKQWVASELLGEEAGAVALQGKTASYRGSEASFRYAGLSDGLKESIEIAKPSAPSTYSFALSASAGLTPSLEEGGAVAFRNKSGHIVVTLPPPTMSDSAGAESRAVRYELGPEREGRWRLTVIADHKWLSAPGRVLPARIDPTMVTGPPYGCVIGGHKGQTGWIDCASWGRETFLVGYTPEPDEEEDNWWRTLMNFETEAIPANAEVSSATFHIHSSEEAENTEGVELRKVTKPWTWQASWSQYDGPEHLWEEEGGDYSDHLGEVLTSERGNQAGWWEFSLPPEIVEEEAAAEEDLPVIMKLLDDKDRECGEESCTHRQVTFDSSAAEDEEDRPYLSVVYSVPSHEEPIAAYSFDEGSGETAIDDSGNGHEGTIKGAEWTSEGKHGDALEFGGEGASDLVTVPASKALALGRDFTLEAWVRPNTDESWSSVVAKETQEGLSYQLLSETAFGAPAGIVFNGNEEEAKVEGSGPVPLHEWSHLALTSDGEHLRLYIDGELVDTAPALTADGEEGPLQIGGDLPWEEDSFDGRIDDVRLYDRALDVEEIEADEETAILAGFDASISGTPQQGNSLSADFGDWIGPSPASFDYQWERCNTEGASCEGVEGARGRTYYLSASDVGRAIRVTIRAQSGPMATSRSTPTSPVLEGGPLAHSTPLIYGNLAVGKTISTQSLEWWPWSAGVAYQWRRCDSKGSACEDISGATSQHYAVQAADAGATLRVHETATTNGGSASADSDASEVVPAPSIANTVAPSVTESSSLSGTLLTADPGTWSGKEIVFRYQWERCNGAGGECADLSEEEGATLRPQVDEVGSSYRVQVEASNASESQVLTSGATAALEEDKPGVTKAPGILGRARAGRVLEGEPGAWTGLGPAESSLQWFRCDASGEACQAIAEATESEYELSAEDIGSTIRLEETLENSAGNASATSAATAVVSSASGSGPILEEEPSISGDAELGAELTASPGIWGGAVEYSYQWERCDSSGQQCEPIAEADGETYELGVEDVGHAVAVEVTAEGEDEGTSSATAITGQSVRLPEAPRSVSAPALEGSFDEGDTLTVEPGIWEGTEPLTFSYRWQRCEAGECEDIEGATGKSHEVSRDDVMHGLRAVVTAQNEAGETTAVSATTSSVGSRSPFDETAPTLSGGDRTGETLTAKPGTWQGDAPIAFAYSWLRCDSSGMSCEEIPGVEGSSYELSGADVGATIRASVEASNAKGKAQASSAPSSPISDAGGPTSLAPPTVSGEPAAGELITATSGKWEGAEGFSYQWQRCGLEPESAECVNIAGATAANYTIGNADGESGLRVLVSASGKGGDAFALSEETESIESRNLPAPKNEKPPTIEGAAEEFQTISVDPGKWKSPYPLSYRYQWESCDAGGSGCVAIEGAASSTYTPQWWDVGGTVRAVVIASGEGSGRAVISAASEEVTQAPPSNLEPPFIESGKALDQETLHSNFGSWQGDDLSYSWEWELCNAEGKECELAEEGESETYKVRTSQIGHTLRFRVTVSNRIGSASVASAATEVIAVRAPEPGGLPEIKGETLQDGILEGYEGWWWGTPPLSLKLQWQRCSKEGKECKDIPGATEAKYTTTAADVGSRLRLKVEASSEYGSAEAFSEPSAVIAPPSLPAVGSPGPSIEGMPYDGRTYTAKPGTWTGHAPISFSYQWQRCSKEGEECKDISGATEVGYLTTSADLSATIRVSVTASNTSGSASEFSAVSKAITSAKVANTAVPTISGKNQPPATLEASTGSWSGSGPLKYAYEWQRCNAAGKECKAIEGASKASYTLQSADGKKTVRVSVTATGALGSASATSSTLSILPEKSTNTSSPTISGAQFVGNKLTASPGEWSPVPEKYTYQWQRCSAAGTGCFNLGGQTSATYTPGLEDREKTLKVRVTAENKGEPEPPAEFSSATAVISSTYPTNMEVPVLSTTEPIAEQKISATTGVWNGLPTITYAYQWQHCVLSKISSFCWDIPGATESSYLIDSEYTGEYLQVTVTAKSGEGYGESSSALSGEIGPSDNPPLPENTTTPTISGVTVVGSPLSANPGTWNGASYWTYEWQRCSSEGKECKGIEAATEETYTPNRADLGHTLRVVVTGYQYVGWWAQATASSEPSQPVGEATRPSSESPPEIEGGAEVGKTLKAIGGSWHGSATISYSFVWLRCDALGRNCEASSGPFEYAASYEVADADAGHTMRLRETATNGGGSVTVTSDATSIVPAAPTLANLGLPELFGTPSYDSLFGASRGEWTGVPGFEFQWERCDPLTFEPEEESIECIDIPEATKPVVNPSAADVGYELRLRETAINGKESMTVHSNATSTSVAVGIGERESAISGLAVTGATITANSGLEFDAELPTETEYQFWRVVGKTREELQSGPSPKYEVQEADLGSRIEVVSTMTAWRADKAITVAERSNWALTPEVEVGPTNDVPPAVSGEAVAGATLEVEPGKWHGGGGSLSYGYRWRLCDENGEVCKDIPEAEEQSYEIRAGDIGSTVKVAVTASDGPLSEVAESEPSEVVQAAEVPSVEESPLIYGEPLETRTLEAEPGVWSGSEPRSYAYQWQGCELEDPTSCLDIEDATEATLPLDRSVVGQSLRIVVTATNAAGSTTAASELTESIEAAPAPTPTKMPSIDVLGPPDVGSTLVTDGGAWEYVNPDEIEYQWLRCPEGGECKAVEGADNPTYDLEEEDVGTRLEVEVIGENSSGRVSITSGLSPEVGKSTGSAEGEMVYLNPDRTKVYMSDLEGESPKEIADCKSLGGKENCALYAPKISPNDELIALEVREAKRKAGEGAVIVMNFDGTEPRLLAEGSEPSWSANGTQLYLTSTDPEEPSETQVVAASASGSGDGEPTVIFKPARMEGSPDISPDGKSITYSAPEPSKEVEGELVEGARGLYVAALDGSSSTRLDLGPMVREAIDPRFTADGKEIVFVASRTDYPDDTGLAFWDVNQLWTVNANGTDPHPLTPKEWAVYGAPSTHGGGILVGHQDVTEVSYGGGYSLEYGKPELRSLGEKGDEPHALPVEGVEPDGTAQISSAHVDRRDCPSGRTVCKRWTTTDRLEAAAYGEKWSKKATPKFNPSYWHIGNNCTNFVSQAWYKAGQEFMDEWSRNSATDRWWADKNRESRTEMNDSNWTWSNVEGFRDQQTNSLRAKNLGRLLSADWQEGDVILLNWLEAPEGQDEVPDHALIVTRANGKGRFIASETAPRHNVPWHEEWTRYIREFFEDEEHSHKWPYGWTWEVLRPVYKAANRG